MEDSPNVVVNSDSYKHMDWSPDYEYGSIMYSDDDVNNGIDNEKVSTIENYNSKAMQYVLSVKSSASKVKRSIELAEEHPPEGTARPQYNEGENLTPRSSSLNPSIPSMPSMPSLPQPPTIPSLDPKNSLDIGKNNELTTSPNVEMLETTTEDYGNIGEPNCDYDPFTFILKCGINLITSIFGLSDSCCKSLF